MAKNRKRGGRNRRNLPPGNRIPRSIEEVSGGRPVAVIEEYEVGSWCPTPDGTGPAEAVVIHFKGLKLPVDFAIKMKSRAAVEEMIDALTRHMNDVWPGGEDA